MVEKPGWSVETVLAQLEHPLVTAHVVPYVPGSVIEARTCGYSKGTHPFVTWVDPDDEVLDLSWLPEALAWMEDQAVSMVFPRWRSSGAKTFTMPVLSSVDDLNMGTLPHAHQLSIMRRTGVEVALSQLRQVTTRMMLLTDVAIARLQLQSGRVIQHPAVAYHWKIGTGAHQVYDGFEAATIELMRRSGAAGAR